MGSLMELMCWATGTFTSVTLMGQRKGRRSAAVSLMLCQAARCSVKELKGDRKADSVPMRR